MVKFPFWNMDALYLDKRTKACRCARTRCRPAWESQ
jgi:hypothetical protein